VKKWDWLRAETAKTLENVWSRRCLSQYFRSLGVKKQKTRPGRPDRGGLLLIQLGSGRTNPTDLLHHLRTVSTDELAGVATGQLIILRKEVIQPQVPLRLPCYDLVPIAEFTFGACFPCGLARRLRVLPTFVA
jgi:hypothetical protein